MTECVTYAYAVARNTAGLEEAAAALTGVADTPVHLVRGTRGDELVLAVSGVPAHDFQEDALKTHLEDLAWLEAVARAHHGVIEALAALTTVLPLRLATVYLDDDRARSILEAEWPAFADRLSRLAAHIEWGVKIYVEAAARPAAPGTGSAAANDLSPGRAYLRTRKAQQSVRDDVYRAAQRAAERVEAAGRRHAADRARHRVQQGELATAPGENVVNDAYLVPLDLAEAFRTEVSSAADGIPGVRIEVTGPWAPYSFAMPPDASADAAEGARP
ncbi:GvpL/GvpF family gas vesicle protein [Streptomyces sp. NBC_00316]|uniref:GvpL/GvpF family gas vesicle protein n=1 Tax=Streptomyces sp. NBC_00316 TaxID=2975710 RepID=UPI002E2DDE37|nr:GvpL/GvpF family gas vesicle protein [Streptomyces sp. NBC_00316]